MLDAHKLVEIRKSLGLNQEEFGRKIGYRREVVSKVENGKMEPSRWFVEAVLKFQNDTTFPQTRHDVKILGKSSHEPRRFNQPFYKQIQTLKNQTSEFLVPLVGIKAQAGYVKGFEQTDFIDTLERYSLPPGVNPKGLEWSYFEVDGDSMEPTISAGDILLTSLLPHEDWMEIKNFYVYVILTDEQLLVKRVYNKNEKEWIFISDNSETNPQVSIEVSKVKQVWTLRRHIRSRLPQPSEVKITA
ncbi:MAG: LexA family transcriptional regulator [Flavisolibacter sp.]